MMKTLKCSIAAVSVYGFCWLFMWPLWLINLELLDRIMNSTEQNNDGTWALVLPGFMVFAEQIILSASAFWFTWRFLTRTEQTRQQSNPAP
jgi:hypothetical protein